MTSPTSGFDEFSEEAINNNDIDMDADTLGHMEPHVRAAMGEPRIKEAFDRYEAQATKYKDWHNRVGTVSLILLIVALVFGLLRLTGELFGYATTLHPFTAVAVVLGSIPFVCAAALRLFRVHEHWVLARFRAERIRHWKFHQLLDGDYIEHLGLPPAAVGDALDDQWRILRTDLAAGTKQMDKYVNSTPFGSKFLYDNATARAYKDPEIFRNAATVFYNARLRFQRRWFVRESDRYQARDRWTKRAAGWLLSLSVLTAFGEGILHFGAPRGTAEHAGLAVVAVSIGLALLSAGFRVYRSASGISENAERYQRISEYISWYEDRYYQLLRKKTHNATTIIELMGIMEAIEHLCHGEMVEFIRVSRKSDYFF